MTNCIKTTQNTHETQKVQKGGDDTSCKIHLMSKSKPTLNYNDGRDIYAIMNKKTHIFTLRNKEKCK